MDLAPVERLRVEDDGGRVAGLGAGDADFPSELHPREGEDGPGVGAGQGEHVLLPVLQEPQHAWGKTARRARPPRKGGWRNPARPCGISCPPRPLVAHRQDSSLPDLPGGPNGKPAQLLTKKGVALLLTAAGTWEPARPPTEEWTAEMRPRHPGEYQPEKE